MRRARRAIARPHPQSSAIRALTTEKTTIVYAEAGTAASASTIAHAQRGTRRRSGSAGCARRSRPARSCTATMPQRTAPTHWAACAPGWACHAASGRWATSGSLTCPANAPRPTSDACPRAGSASMQRGGLRVYHDRRSQCWCHPSWQCVQRCALCSTSTTRAALYTAIATGRTEVLANTVVVEARRGVCVADAIP